MPSTSLSLAIVTPSYNQGKFIRRTIESVLGQDVAVDYVIMDGGSTDDTLPILAEYTGKLAWTSRPDKGQADGVNNGIQASHGDIIGWLNSDDIYYPGAFRPVLDYFANNPGIDVVYGDANHIDENDRIIEPYYTEDWNLQRLFDVCFICQPAAFFRRSLIDRFGLLNISYNTCMDYELWIRWGLMDVSFHHLPVLVAGSRLYPENKTLRNRERVHREINDMLKAHLGYVPERWIHNYGYAVGDTRRISRDNKVRFSILASLYTWYASVKWNKCLPLRLVAKTSHWMAGNIKNRVREMFGR